MFNETGTEWLCMATCQFANYDIKSACMRLRLQHGWLQLVVSLEYVIKIQVSIERLSRLMEIPQLSCTQCLHKVVQMHAEHSKKNQILIPTNSTVWKWTVPLFYIPEFERKHCLWCFTAVILKYLQWYSVNHTEK